MSELATLCRSCGLCCDGSLFGRVPLKPAEVAVARARKLHVIPSGKAFEQPCTALAGDRTCRVYDERPAACRRFTCVLYETHAREGGPLDARLENVRHARTLLAQVQANGPEDPACEELADVLGRCFARA